MGGALPFSVQATVPEGVVKVVESTTFVVTDEALEQTGEPSHEVTYEDIGGLDEELRRINPQTS
jgi:ATP-dependent 26S proteasome regulatory subunit